MTLSAECAGRPENTAARAGIQFASALCMLNLRNVLIATDFSECSDKAVQEGFALAERFGARVHLLHVVAGPVQEMWSGYVPAEEFVGVVNAHKAEARRRLARAAEQFGSPSCAVELVTAYGVPLDEILDYARVHRIDLVVCGTHGRRGIDRVVAGSVAERIVQLAPCPVLTVSSRRGGAAAAA